MSLSRSPSPVPGGGWASPGLNINTSGRSSPTRTHSGNGDAASWGPSRSKSSMASGYPSFSTQNEGFFTRHMRKLSHNLSRFSAAAARPVSSSDKEKPGRSSRWALHNSPLSGVRGILARMGRKLKIRLLIAFLILLSTFLLYQSCKPSVTIPSESPQNPLTITSPPPTWLIEDSSCLPLAQKFLARWRREVRHNISCQCGRWCHGVEGRPGVGH